MKDLEEKQKKSYDWWESRRLNYNIGLAICSILAFFFHLMILASFPSNFPELEITLFTLLFSFIGFILFMGLANFCYFLGVFSERFPIFVDINYHRRVTYYLGCCFSFVLPFSAPILTLLSIFYCPNCEF
ncbi:MAG: hypothetical protein HY819_12425 [Acidobacteria bacterium]|nr:hypothetical protein [Acidobacteriota bacterium]